MATTVSNQPQEPPYPRSLPGVQEMLHGVRPTHTHTGTLNPPPLVRLPGIQETGLGDTLGVNRYRADVNTATMSKSSTKGTGEAAESIMSEEEEAAHTLLDIKHDRRSVEKSSPESRTLSASTSVSPIGTTAECAM